MRPGGVIRLDLGQSVYFHLGHLYHICIYVSLEYDFSEADFSHLFVRIGCLQ